MNEYFLTSWKKLVNVEGGYVDDPSDSGGATNWGVTERVAREFGYRGHMRDLPRELAEEIAKKKYWDVMSLDDIAPLSYKVAYELFDTGYNTGTTRPSTWLQRALNGLNNRERLYQDLNVDGRIGPITISMLRAYLDKRGLQGEDVLVRLLNGLQAAFYLELVERREKDEKFLYGWILHRVTI